MFLDRRIESSYRLPDSKIGLVLEYCPLGDMYNHIWATSIDPGTLWWYFDGVVSHHCTLTFLPSQARCHQVQAVRHLHHHGVVHRDIKPENVVVDGAFTPKLCDFGMSGTEGSTVKGAGTRPYMPPEILAVEVCQCALRCDCRVC